jgi:lactobin A/cerein 7B family class IIb bacteriocin
LLSKENGFNFTQADLEYMENLATSYQNGELTEEQLEMVSGGSVVLILMLIFGAIGIGCFSAMAAMGFSETKRGH